MILLDTHVWVWWVQGNPQLKEAKKKILKDAEKEGLGVSVMSCWEVGKLVERGRLTLPVSLHEWIDKALEYPGVELLDLTRLVLQKVPSPTITLATTKEGKPDGP